MKKIQVELDDEIEKIFNREYHLLKAQGFGINQKEFAAKLIKESLTLYSNTHKEVYNG